MRLITEINVENTDFLEVILTEAEIKKIPEKGVVQEFRHGLYGKRNLNIFIRSEDLKEPDYKTFE